MVLCDEPDPDYSAAYVVLKTNKSHEGHGLILPSVGARAMRRCNRICISIGPSLTRLIKEDMGAFGAI